jgi:hypothetical protein
MNGRSGLKERQHNNNKHTKIEWVSCKRKVTFKKQKNKHTHFMVFQEDMNTIIPIHILTVQQTRHKMNRTS